MKSTKKKITIEEWEDMFERMKKNNIPVNEKKMFTKYGFQNSNYHDYCLYINSVLKVIRGGEQDYCYFTYQIKDLLRFEPELNVIYDYVNEVFIVWLDK